ncbi:MAG: hypothetical protein GXY34_05135 [Syntrophomonadaceae bacterium]|nr:hypothetical protein [Syntrophomonadaceae bacterium]
MEETSGVKKLLWKKWWFWGVIIVLLIAFASGGDDKTDTTSNNNVSGSKATVSTPVDKPDNSFKSGMYKVGSDIPAGEYVLATNAGGYFAVTSDSSGSFESILANDNFSNRSIVTVSDGQYLELKGCKAYPFAEAPAIDKSGGVLESGMYKVGIDIPAGEYKVESDGGYIEVSSSSNHNLDSITTNDNFEGTKYITVSDGQYLKVNNVKIHLNS